MDRMYTARDPVSQEALIKEVRLQRVCGINIPPDKEG
jgi:hypothetical protein